MPDSSIKSQNMIIGYSLEYSNNIKVLMGLLVLLDFLDFLDNESY